MNIERAKEFTSFIKQSPSVFHVVYTIKEELDAHGFTYLKEGSSWNIEAGGKYYTTRNDSSIIAFTIGKDVKDYHYQMSAAHVDSPVFKVKSIPEVEGVHEYLKLNVEAYGGMIDSTWLDKPLSIAGRVLVRKGNTVERKFVSMDKDVVLIPNLCIHFNRGMNEGYKYNRQIDLAPLFSAGEMKVGDFDNMLAKKVGVEASDILGKDVYLVNTQEPKVWGYKDEFVSSPKIDDLSSVFIALKGFVEADNARTINVFCGFDNEEVGSGTKQGAKSTFLKHTLHRINGCLGKSDEEFYQALSKSFLVSGDGAQAMHPNHPETSDAYNRAYLNKGVVIKESANQKYTSDAFSRAVITAICKDHDIPVQTFANRSDIPGGSTLGNLSNLQISVHAVDLGLPQLAMHSSYETAGSLDFYYGVEAFKAYYNTNIIIDEAEKFCLE